MGEVRRSHETPLQSSRSIASSPAMTHVRQHVGLSISDQAWTDSVQLGRSVAGALMLGVMWAAESIAPMFVGRTHRVRHGISNLVMSGINVLVGMAFAVPIVAATEWARHKGFGLLHWISLPTWAHWLAAFLLIDAWQYAWHRLNHRVPALWRFHAVHHADAELDATSGLRFHTLEIALSSLARLLLLPLAGITIPELIFYEAISLPIIVFQHANIRLPASVDRVLRTVMVTPWMHWVHHSHWQPETDSNYSSVLSIWDRLFGSFRLNPKPWEIRLGLDGWKDPEWRSVPGMLQAPWTHREPEEHPNRPVEPSSP